MTEHDHREFVPGCYRCELGRDEAQHDPWTDPNVRPVVNAMDLVAAAAVSAEDTPEARAEKTKEP